MCAGMHAHCRNVSCGSSMKRVPRPPPAASKWRALPVKPHPLNCQQGGMKEGLQSTHLTDQSSGHARAHRDFLFITNWDGNGGKRSRLMKDGPSSPILLTFAPLRLNEMLWQTESTDRARWRTFTESVYKVDCPFAPLLVLLSSYPTINIPIFKGSQRKQEGFD